MNVLEKGDDTIMDDSNLIFSLTIKKKIALARCIYANVDILLLDWFF
jgi:ABC-type protease/lipase transport system fused ATPase/permease subunit